MAITLKKLGWDSAWQKKFDSIHKSDWEPARIAVEDKLNYVIVTPEDHFPAQIAGRLIHHTPSKALLPKVGDWVAASILFEESKAIIHQVLPRRTVVSRKSAGRETEEQVLAANVDKVFVVQALDQSFNPRLVERHLLMVMEGGAQPIVILNKADLCDEIETRIDETRICAGGAEILVVSALTGDHIGDLSEHIAPGETVAFIGSSGVGKSSLINRLYGEEVQPTIEVRAWDSKGRHTTTWRELILLPSGGMVIDTPGMREFHLWFGNEGVEQAYSEFQEFAPHCRFRDCTHTVEKGCAVIEAVTSGKISAERHSAYLKLRKELDRLEESTRYRNRGASADRKRLEKMGSRALKKFYREDHGG